MAPVDLSGWQITGGAQLTIPAGTMLAADEYLVVSGNSAALAYNIVITPIAQVPFTWTGASRSARVAP